MKAIIYVAIAPFVIAGAIIAVPVAGLVGGFKVAIDYLDKVF